MWTSVACSEDPCSDPPRPSGLCSVSDHVPLPSTSARSSIIIVLVGSVDSGGAAQAIRRLVDLWRSHGVDVTLIAYRSAAGRLLGARLVSLDEDVASRGAEQSVIVMARSAGIIHRTMRTIRRTVRERPDAVVMPFLTGTSLITLAATLCLGRRIVVCERSDVTLQIHGWHVRLLRRVLYPFAAAITINSPNPAAIEHLQRISRGRPIHHVPNPRPPKSRRATPSTSRTILTVGRLVTEKQQAILIEAFATVVEHLPEWRLSILGEGPLRPELESQIERLAITHRVTLHGHMDDPMPHYESAAIFVLPSAYEGTSNALLEAATAGLPCLVSDTAVPPDGSGAVRTVAVDDPDALSHELLTLCQNEALRDQLGAAAWEWVSGSDDQDILDKWDRAMHTAEGTECCGPDA